jgi:hypothetical protein
MRYCAIGLFFGALVVLAPCSIVSAALLRYEPFDYTDTGTNVEGKTTADGGTWVSAYAAAAPTEITVAGGNLAVPHPLLPPVGNSAEVDGSGNGAGKAIRLPLGGGIAQDAGGTMYYSMALRVDALTGSTNTSGGFFAALNNGAGATTANPTAAAARLQGRIDPVDPTKYNLGIFRNVNATAAAPSWSGPLTLGETIFLVASYESVPDVQNDIARLWINPDPSTFGDASFSLLDTPPTVIDSTTGVGTDIGVFSMILRQGPAPHVTLDELRVGTTWADVTPTPEPASFGLLLIAFMLMCWRGRSARV